MKREKEGEREGGREEAVFGPTGQEAVGPFLIRPLLGGMA
jgi:hypothetical protein